MPGSPEPDRAAALAAERCLAAEQVEVLTRDLARVVQASESSNADDEHDPEGSTIAFERAQLSAMLDAARRRVQDVDGALARLAAGDDGRCERCGSSIGDERLLARPWTRLCIACARDQRQV
ncbi:TraR/DksA family transcriptional regulator [Angustibacter sp. McL0619]|uniref:TraR/DksA family transcriptional regulator n=1 Tax=Angustibacter sp. McL0619 TaxID=3415676 RepID=UPI003CE79476